MSDVASTRAQRAIATALRESEALDLHGLGLEAVPSLGDLIHLRRLDVSGNRLQALPDDVWALTALEHLDLGGVSERVVGATVRTPGAETSRSAAHGRCREHVASGTRSSNRSTRGVDRWQSRFRNRCRH